MQDKGFRFPREFCPFPIAEGKNANGITTGVLVPGWGTVSLYLPNAECVI